MRRLILTLMAAIVALNVRAGSGEVIMSKQVLPHSNLPEKTDEWKFKNLKLDTAGHQFKMLRALAPLIKQVTDDDYEYFVFSIELKPGIGQTTITIKAFDPLTLTPANRKLLVAGVVKLPHDYLVVCSNPASSDLVSQITRKASGSTKFVREYELVNVPVQRHKTSVTAVWDGTQLTVTEMMINGDDRLMPKQPEQPAPALMPLDTVQRQ